jgi:TFIIF-interacting CTD phosphatase-like protein
MRAPEVSIDEMKERFKKLKIHHGENLASLLTLIIGLDGFLMKTSVFPKEIPRIDAQFSYNNITVYVCFRPHFREFIEECAKRFELILWSPSPSEYTEKLFNTLPENL